MIRKIILIACVLVFCAGNPVFLAGEKNSAAENSPGQIDYLLIATSKTSTAQKEMTEAAESGYRFAGVMGGETSFGGSEVVVIMSKDKGIRTDKGYDYKLLATSKTSTMQKELQEAGDAGFEYKGQTVFKSAFGGDEVVVILERDRDRKLTRYIYKLLATKRTKTMQKELREAGDAGFEFVGVTVSKSAFGGNEIISILRKRVN